MRAKCESVRARKKRREKQVRGHTRAHARATMYRRCTVAVHTFFINGNFVKAAEGISLFLSLSFSFFFLDCNFFPIFHTENIPHSTVERIRLVSLIRIIEKFIAPCWIEWKTARISFCSPDGCCKPHSLRERETSSRRKSFRRLNLRMHYASCRFYLRCA